MADFCTTCAKQMDFPEPDIDILKEGEDIDDGYYKAGYICEGCGLFAIGKFDGKIKVAMVGEDDREDYEWKDYDPDFVSRAFKSHD